MNLFAYEIENLLEKILLSILSYNESKNEYNWEKKNLILSEKYCAYREHYLEKKEHYIKWNLSHLNRLLDSYEK